MPQTLYVGGHESLTETPRQIHSRAEVETIQPLEVIQRWDYVMRAPSQEELLPPSKLAPIRNLSDTLADELVDYLELKPGEDAFKALEKALEGGEDGRVDKRVEDFWNSVNREPPSCVSGLVGDRKERRKEEFTPVESIMKNDRMASPSLSAGQAVFKRYSAPIFAALLHFSLAGGFSSPKLAAVMNETNYLTSGSRDATYFRLLETNVWVLDAMTDMSVGGIGWKSTIRVRLLHAMVRRKIRLGKGKLNVYDQAKSGIPINQADLCAVLGSFMIAPIWSMSRTGIYLNDAEKLAYKAAWVHIGYYLGIDEDLLVRFYGRDWLVAETAFACMAFDVFPEDVPADGFNTSTYRILSAVANRPPIPHGVNYHLEYSRRLLGDKLANQLALPRGNFRDRFTVELDIWSSWYLICFGRAWRKEWEIERQLLFAEIIEILVVWQLGSKRSNFAWRKEENHAKVLGENEGESPGIVMGVAAGKRIKSRWSRLLLEMIGVSVIGFGAVGIGLVLGTIRIKNLMI